MARTARPASTSNNPGRRAQPQVRPPLSQEYVNAHPELCLAPRLPTLPLPQQTQPDLYHSRHTYYPTAYVPPPRGSSALHLVPGPHAQAGRGPNPNASHPYYPSAYQAVNAVPAIPSQPSATATSRNAPSFVPSLVPHSQSSPVAIPKSRYGTSPPTPESTPPRPAVASRRKRTSTDDAQRGHIPKT